MSIKSLVEKRNIDRGKGAIRANKSKQKSAKEQAKLDNLIMQEYEVMAGYRHGNRHTPFFTHLIFCDCV